MTPELKIDLNAALKTVETLARQAGDLQREAVTRPRQIEFKGERNNLVTATDRACEALIVGGLREAYPDHAITGEEGTAIRATTQAIYRWHVDPLDGTTNFAHGIPYFCVSIGLAAPDGLPVLGVVYHALLDECFSAIRRQGATLNGQPIHVSSVPELSGALLVTGFTPDRWVNPDNNSREWLNFLVRAQAVSRMGAAALDLAYVAAGRFDGFWEMRVNSWDVMAGMLLVTEAGGRVSDYAGVSGADAVDSAYSGREFVASNGLIHDQMVAVIAMTRGHGSQDRN